MGLWGGDRAWLEITGLVYALAFVIDYEGIVPMGNLHVGDTARNIKACNLGFRNDLVNDLVVHGVLHEDSVVAVWWPLFAEYFMQRR